MHEFHLHKNGAVKDANKLKKNEKNVEKNIWIGWGVTLKVGLHAGANWI